MSDKLITEDDFFSSTRITFGPFFAGVEMKFKNMHYPVMIAASHIKELRKITGTDSGLKFGGSVTLTELEHTLKEQISSLPGQY